MTETPPQEEGVILEPGDPGYVAPEGAQTQETTTQTDVTAPGPNDPLGAPAPGPNDQPGGYTDPSERPPDEPRVQTVPNSEEVPAGEDLQHVQQPGETDAEFAARTRGTVVDSQSPTDIVPNTPQITIGARVQVEGTDPPVYVGVPPEYLDEDQPEVPPEESEEPVVEETPEAPVEEPAA